MGELWDVFCEYFENWPHKLIMCDEYKYKIVVDD